MPQRPLTRAKPFLFEVDDTEECRFWHSSSLFWPGSFPIGDGIWLRCKNNQTSLASTLFPIISAGLMHGTGFPNQSPLPVFPVALEPCHVQLHLSSSSCWAATWKTQPGAGRILYHQDREEGIVYWFCQQMQPSSEGGAVVGTKVWTNPLGSSKLVYLPRVLKSAFLAVYFGQDPFLLASMQPLFVYPSGRGTSLASCSFTCGAAARSGKRRPAPSNEPAVCGLSARSMRNTAWLPSMIGNSVSVGWVTVRLICIQLPRGHGLGQCMAYVTAFWL